MNQGSTYFRNIEFSSLKQATVTFGPEHDWSRIKSDFFGADLSQITIRDKLDKIILD